MRSDFLVLMLKRVRQSKLGFDYRSHQQTAAQLCSLIYSIWLFTFSDLKTILIPSTFFGISNAIAGPVFGLQSTLHAAVTPLNIVFAIGRVVLWVWLTLLPFTINNQRSPASIAEDAVNKPWRPLPSRRLSAEEAAHIANCIHPVNLLVSFLIGGWRQAVAGILLGRWYNDWRGSEDFFMKQIINASGYFCFTSGALEVALGQPLEWTRPLLCWLGLVGVVVFSTVYSQDMYDQAGDSLRNRKTVPLVIGDAAARYLLASTMLMLGMICPWVWGMPFVVSGLFLCIASVIGIRSLLLRTIASDKATFRLWNVWIMFLYSFPLINYRLGLY